ncbi:acyltransferase [Tenacibaculum sp. 190524A02b]|uniref:acyltransferase n=1 Tax=Tenacibaculum vairaonense TaxID=3137860 RepID=UPI0031FB7C03
MFFLWSKIKFISLKRRVKKHNPEVTFGGFSTIEFENKLKTNGTVYIGPGAFWSLKGGLSLGNNVIFGPKTSIWTYNHDYKSDLSIPYGGSDILKEVIIEDNCWIGYGTIILPGTIIREGSVIAAGSVVNGEIPKRSLVMGNPSNVIKKLDEESYEELKKKKKFYLNLKNKK